MAEVGEAAGASGMQLAELWSWAGAAPALFRGQRPGRGLWPGCGRQRGGGDRDCHVLGDGFARPVLGLPLSVSIIRGRLRRGTSDASTPDW